jgi:hypothetical protein
MLQGERINVDAKFRKYPVQSLLIKKNFLREINLTKTTRATLH